MKYPAMSLFAIRSFARGSAKNLFSVRAILLKSTATWRLRFAMVLPVLLYLVLGAQAQTNVVTQHNDNSRTGQNNNETILTPSNVNSNTFGRLFSYPIDGQAYAQPLYVAGVTMGSGTVQAGTTHNVVFVATQHDSVYAFDADSNGGSNASPLWKITLLDSLHGAGWGATTVPSGDVGTDDINPEIGITATPVIDTTTNTLYVVGKTKENGNYFQRLHALDITTGAEKSGSPVTLSAQVNGNGNGSSGGVLGWDAKLENNRPGLLLLNGTVYIAFAAHGDLGPYHGWILAYNAATLQQTSVFCPTANGAASGIWMSGAGLAADTINSGRLFVATGNGAFNAAPPYSNSMSYGDDLIRLETSSGVMRVSDQFAAFNQNYLSDNDLDLGSGGVLLLPDQSSGPTHLMVQASKEGRIYLVDRDNLGGYNSGGDNIVQEVAGRIGGLWGSPAYWNGHLYFWASNDSLKSFSFSNGSIGNNTSASSENGGYPGPTPSISSNGSSNGIVWDVLSSAYTSGGAAVLLAHNATDVSNTLYSSNQNSSRDNPGGAIKFAVPTVTNGKVYVGTSNFLSVYGLLGAAPQASAPVLNPGGENFTGSVSVAITDSTPGASIFYTTNGSTPTTSSPKYSGPISVTATETIKAIASASGYRPSAVASETYNLQSQSGGGGSSTINFGSGFGSAQNSMRFNGSAALSNGLVQLTNGGSSQAGSAWFNTTVNITQFTNDFAFQLVNPNADGITFTIQNAGLSALGNTGGSLGYAGIGNSVAVKFDLYNNSGEGIDSTGLYQNGAMPATPASDLSSSGINLHSGDKFSVHMTYNGATLSMTITDGSTGAVYNTSWSINIPQVIGSNTAYVGFTAGTGGLTATQNIQTWSFVSGAQQQATATAPVFSPAAGSYTGSQSVTLSTPTPGASMHYTTDGSTPSASSTLYSRAITVSATETIKALAVASGYSNSAVSAGTYTISSGGSGSGGGGVSLGGGFTAGAMALNGSATLNGTRLRLTDGGGSEAAAAWYNSPVNIQQFTTSFSFQITPGNNSTADGFTFAIQGNNTAVVGPSGGALGYGNGSGGALAQKSVAVKFDLYDNAGEGVNSTGLFTNGAVPTTPSVDLTGSGIDLHSGDVMNVQISYDGTNLSMTITDPTANATFTHAWPVNISSVVGAHTAFAGFTAGTGGRTAIQDIINWTFTPGTSAPVPPPGGGGTSAINFGSGFSATGMQFNGNAALVGNRLQLSDTSTTFEDSSAFWNQKVNVQSFTNDFTFQIANPGADGITFAIQGSSPTALGVVGGSLGYGGMTNSVGVKFDIYDNAGEGTNSTGLYLNGAVPTVPATTVGGGVNLQSGDVMTVHMTYDGTTLTMTIKDTSNPTQTFTTSWPVNIPATVGSTAYVGFTGATGGLVSTEQILTWSYSTGTSAAALVVETAGLAAAATTSGPAVQVFSYQNFPDGLGTMFYSSSVGDYVTFMVNVPAAGTYDVKISYKQYQPRGIVQTAINNASVGPPVDQFISNADAYAVTDLGAVNFPSAGNYPFTFKVVGKNPASTAYSLAFDDITLTPQ
jgi:Legume lectin domain/Chitobiase/beta-hexosaminidase C-terminal domain